MKKIKILLSQTVSVYFTRNRIRTALMLSIYAVMLLSGCSQWPTMFQHIDGHRPRLLDIIYYNISDTTLCEAAPGDTLAVEAWFAGEDVSNIEWKISYNVYLEEYGGSGASDIENLTILDTLKDSLWRDSIYKGSVRCFAFSFVVKKDAFRKNISGQEIESFIPVNIDSMLNMIDTVAALSPQQRQESYPEIYGMLKSGGYKYISMLSLPIRLFATVNNVHRMRSDFVVRYKKYFTDLDKIFVNRNPEINYLAVYKIKGEKKKDFNTGSMDKKSDSTFILHYNGEIDSQWTGGFIKMADTILIDTGYHYYIAADSGVYAGVDQRDSCIDTESSNIYPEKFVPEWFIEHASDEAEGINSNSLLIVSGNTPVSDLYPPLDTAIHNARIWVQVYDDFSGEYLRNRLRGSDLLNKKIYIKYTEAYAEDLNGG